MRLARSQWQMPTLKMGKDGGVPEAEKWLGEIGRPRAMMLHTGLQKIGDASLEQKELLELEDMMSSVVFTYIKNHNPPPKCYETLVPLV